MAGPMKEAYIQRFGEKKWLEHIMVIGEMWIGLAREVEGLHLPYKKLKIYQDGLPVCGKEREIVEDLARQGSPNHRLLYLMMRRGATVVGTEDAKLLLEEYSYLKRIAETKTHREKERLRLEYEKKAPSLLKKRDNKIAERILSTLKEGETGILFIGLLHHVDEFLTSKLDISYLIHRLPFRRSFEMEMAV